MTAATSYYNNGQERIFKLNNEQKALYWQLGIGFIVFVFGIAVGARLFAGETPIVPDGNALFYFTNAFTELMGIGLTVLVIDRLIRYRDRQALKNQLIAQVKNPVREYATVALQRLRDEGWLTGENSVLVGQDLRDVQWEGANLQGVNLSGARLLGGNLSQVDFSKSDLSGTFIYQANLSGANFKGTMMDPTFMFESNLSNANFERIDLSGGGLQQCNLTGANLSGTKLTNANLFGAKLLSANLWGANLQGANLSIANFDGAKLQDAHLEGAHLDGARLSGANLFRAKFDTQTLLPDAVLRVQNKGASTWDKYWTPDTDMSRYTNPNHPDFWEPDFSDLLEPLQPDWWKEKQREKEE